MEAKVTAVPPLDQDERAGPTIRVMPGPEAKEIERLSAASSGTAATLEFAAQDVVFDLQSLSCFYGSFRAVREISLQVPRNQITAIIGPSGSGKSTLLRSFNSMNDLVDGAPVEGR
ncbi:MAG: ATP-binding cassette domain-containing protein, partial [Chloroflexota bacterium]